MVGVSSPSLPWYRNLSVGNKNRITKLKLKCNILKCDMIKGMSQMSGKLILSYRLKQVIASFVLHCFSI